MAGRDDKLMSPLDDTVLDNVIGGVRVIDRSVIESAIFGVAQVAVDNAAGSRNDVDLINTPRGEAR